MKKIANGVYLDGPEIKEDPKQCGDFLPSHATSPWRSEYRRCDHPAKYIVTLKNGTQKKVCGIHLRSWKSKKIEIEISDLA